MQQTRFGGLEFFLHEELGPKRQREILLCRKTSNNSLVSYLETMSYQMAISGPSSLINIISVSSKEELTISGIGVL